MPIALDNVKFTSHQQETDETQHRKYTQKLNGNACGVFFVLCFSHVSTWTGFISDVFGGGKLWGIRNLIQLK